MLFTDIVMPGGISGNVLATRARQLRPSLRILLTSGYTESMIVQQGGLDPELNLLNKPYRRSELAARIRATLDAAS